MRCEAAPASTLEDVERLLGADAQLSAGTQEDPSALRRLGWILALGVMGLFAAAALRSVLDAAGHRLPEPARVVIERRVTPPLGEAGSVVRYEAERSARQR